jgi:hypothetical protein
MTIKTARTKRKDGAAEIKNAEKNTKHLADKLGLGIDEGIFDPVVALRAHGFNTTASCEGHLRWGKPAPWVDIGVFSSVDLPKNTDVLRKKNLIAQQRMIDLLDSFYRLRPADASVRIVIIPVGIFGGFCLTNQAAGVQAILPVASKRKKLIAFQKEFQSFALFLKNALLASAA